MTGRSEAVHAGRWEYGDEFVWELPGGTMTGMVAGALEHGDRVAVERLRQLASDRASVHGCSVNGEPAWAPIQLMYDHMKRWQLGAKSTACTADHETLSVWAARSLPHAPAELSGSIAYDRALASVERPTDAVWSVSQSHGSVPDIGGRWHVGLSIRNKSGTNGMSTFLPLSFTNPRAAFRELASAVARRPLVDMLPWNGHQLAAGDLIAKAAAHHTGRDGGDHWRISQADAHTALFAEPAAPSLFAKAPKSEPTAVPETRALAPVAVLERPTLF